ncbi:MAG: glycosyltransferase [Elusimicrobiales bacterium]|nr:glycosyltransferase [Elusimicrobiales bacterium]
MRILHIADEIWDSGLTEYSLALAAAQKKAGRTVLYLARTESHAQQRAQALELDVRAFDNFWIRLPSVVRAARGFNPDIVNAHTGSSHTLAVTLSTLLPHKAAVIRTRSDARPFRKNFCSGLVWKKTAGFMAANSAILSDFRKVQGSAILSEVVPQGLRVPDGFAPPSQKNLNVFNIGIVARLDPVKGHKTALEAFTLLLKTRPNSRLEIAGEDKNVSARQLREYAAALGVENAVSFRGRVEDVFRYMSGFSAGLIPSLGSEAVSRVALEWLACGVPVIASRVGGLPDLIKDGQTGFLVEPGNPQTLADALLKLAGDTELLHRMGENARAAWLSRHTPEIFEKTAFDFYERALRHISH